MFLCCAVDNIDEAGLERCASHKEPINVMDFNQFHAILFGDTTSVDDSDALSSSRDVLGQVLSDPGVDFVDLLGGGDFACSNSPDRLVGKDDMSPLLGFDFGGYSVELPLDDLLSLLGLPLGESLPEAGDDVESPLECGFDLFPDDLIGLAEQRPPFGMPDDDPVDPSVLQVVGTTYDSPVPDLPGVGSIAVLRAVLCGHLHVSSLQGVVDVAQL